MHYDNYETDARVRAANRGNFFDSINESKMLLTVKIHDHDEDVEQHVEFPFKWEVCGLCNGRGKHVNPSIDCNGISAEEFSEDPEFAEGYMRGDYDQHGMPQKATFTSTPS